MPIINCFELTVYPFINSFLDNSRKIKIYTDTNKNHIEPSLLNIFYASMTNTLNTSYDHVFVVDSVNYNRCKYKYCDRFFFGKTVP